MSDSELKETQPTPVPGETQPNLPVQGTRKSFPFWLAILVVIVLIAIGALSGYGSGMTQRYSAENTIVAGQLQEQFQLGNQALADKQFDVAKQHFEFIIQHDPNFPGVQSAYAQLLLVLQVSPTPLFTPTSLYTATPDVRGKDQIFSHIQELLNASNWDDALTNLDELRKLDPTYHTAQVDGMYYIALRQRGIGKITNPDCKNINLEGGIYDLTLAERFVGAGHLDANAEAYRTWARMYITGASFWDQDWVQAQNYFGQVMAALPNLSDSSCLSASERWRQAVINYALQLMNAGDFCGAEKQYNLAFSIDSPKNGQIYPTATQVKEICVGNANTPATPTP